MKKDIFIDTNIAIRFSNPMDESYKKLIKWLIPEKPENREAYLVVSKKLLAEYYRSTQHATSNTAIPTIVNELLKDGRLINITNQQIKAFQQKHYTKKVVKNLRSNAEDREHIPVVLLSERKYALTRDDNFLYDLENFPKFKGKITVAKHPDDIPYAE